VTPPLSLETPCSCTCDWRVVTIAVEGIDDSDLCTQCFPTGLADLDDITHCLQSRGRGRRLHLSVSHDTSNDQRAGCTGIPEDTIAAKLADPSFEPDYEFDWDVDEEVA